MQANTPFTIASHDRKPQEKANAPFFIATMMNPGFKIPESVLVVIHTLDLQVLVMERRDQEGFWQSVTGSKDSLDESAAETAAREVREETGIDTALFQLTDWQLQNVYEIYPMWRHRYQPGVTQNTEHVFGLTLPEIMPVTLAEREHRQYRWLDWKAAADCCFSASNAEAILQLPQRIRKNETARSHLQHP